MQVLRLHHRHLPSLSKIKDNSDKKDFCYNKHMTLKISILIASMLQVVGAAYLSVGTFENSERVLQVFIQPAGWAFSIWGLIYILSFIYAVYQIIPKYDNKILRATRVPALIGFLGSIVWLYFAGMNSLSVWLTIPILFLMAGSLTFVVNAPSTRNKKEVLLSKKILLPYAAWTGIACWLNIQALLSERSVITNDTTNLITNGFLFICIVFFSLYFFRKANYSLWYGGVILWASIAVVYANLSEESGSEVFAVLASVLGIAVVGLYIKKFKKK